MPIGSNVDIRVGVNNIADKNPPVVPNGTLSACPNTHLQRQHLGRHVRHAGAVHLRPHHDQVLTLKLTIFFVSDRRRATGPAAFFGERNWRQRRNRGDLRAARQRTEQPAVARGAPPGAYCTPPHVPAVMVGGDQQVRAQRAALDRDRVTGAQRGFESLKVQIWPLSSVAWTLYWRSLLTWVTERPDCLGLLRSGLLVLADAEILRRRSWPPRSARQRRLRPGQRQVPLRSPLSRRRRDALVVPRPAAAAMRGGRACHSTRAADRLR